MIDFVHLITRFILIDLIWQATGLTILGRSPDTNKNGRDISTTIEEHEEVPSKKRKCAAEKHSGRRLSSGISPSGENFDGQMEFTAFRNSAFQQRNSAFTTKKKGDAGTIRVIPNTLLLGDESEEGGVNARMEMPSNRSAKQDQHIQQLQQQVQQLLQLQQLQQLHQEVQKLQSQEAYKELCNWFHSYQAPQPTGQFHAAVGEVQAETQDWECENNSVDDPLLWQQQRLGREPKNKMYAANMELSVHKPRCWHQYGSKRVQGPAGEMYKNYYKCVIPGCNAKLHVASKNKGCVDAKLSDIKQIGQHNHADKAWMMSNGYGLR